MLYSDPVPPESSALLALAASTEAQARLLDTILNSSEDLIFVISNAGTCLYANDAAARTAGLPRADMVGRNAAEIGVRSDIASRLAEARTQVLTTGGPVTGELQVPARTGGERTYLYTFSPLSSAPDAVEAIICAARDVTEQRHAEAEAAAATARLNAAYQRDHDIAATLQRSLLQMPPPEAFSGLEVVSLYESGTADLEIGGDFIDAFLVNQTQVALVVGDVAGKGLPAAASIAEAKFTLRGYLREYASCSIGLKRLNSYLFDTPLWEGQSRESFVCLSLAIWDTATGDLTVSVAGEEMPLLVRADGRTEALEAQGMALGILPDSDYSVAATRVDAGDTLLLVTDGITEARQDGGQLGLEGLRRIIAEAGTGIPTATLAARVMAGAKEFGGGRLRDDAALLLARRVTPPPADAPRQ